VRHPGSWTSSIVGFALAVLLATWALDKFADLIYRIWPLLAGIGAAVVVAAGLWRLWCYHRDTW